MDLQALLEELKKIRVPLLALGGFVFVLVLVLGRCGSDDDAPTSRRRDDGGGRERSRADEAVKRDHGKPVLRGDLFLGFDDGETTAEDAFSRRLGSNSYALRKRPYGLRLDELSPFAVRTGASAPLDGERRAPATNYAPDEGDDPEAEMLFKKRGAKPQRKDYKP